jgi:hypothetical protein
MIATAVSSVVADGRATGCRAIDLRVERGIERACSSVLGAAHDRAEGRLPELGSGEERRTRLEIRARRR